VTSCAAARVRVHLAPVARIQDANFLGGVEALNSDDACRTCGARRHRRRSSAIPGTKGEVDMKHQFRAGQTVRLLRNPLRSAAAGEFKVVRTLPDDGGETQYRVKSVREPHERVVKESDLSRD
jgi:hypothetical protein